MENGGNPPRILCLDDYFMVETEKMTTDPDTGRKVKTKVRTKRAQGFLQCIYFDMYNLCFFTLFTFQTAIG